MSETVLVTGISGLIAKRIAFDLLENGFAAVGTLRSPTQADEVRAALRGHGAGDAALARLRFVTADLTADAGRAEAMRGVDAVMHTASPFPLVQPKGHATLIGPAVDGTPMESRSG